MSVSVCRLFKNVKKIIQPKFDALGEYSSKSRQNGNNKLKLLYILISSSIVSKHL